MMHSALIYCVCLSDQVTHNYYVFLQIIHVAIKPKWLSNWLEVMFYHFLMIIYFHLKSSLIRYRCCREWKRVCNISHIELNDLDGRSLGVSSRNLATFRYLSKISFLRHLKCPKMSPNIEWIFPRRRPTCCSLKWLHGLVSLYVRILFHERLSIRCLNPRTISFPSKWIRGCIVITIF